MIEPGDRVLVAVSGRQGLTRPVAAAPQPRVRRRRVVRRSRHRRVLRHLRVVRPRASRRRTTSPSSRSTCPTDYGFDVPDGSRAAKRAPCSACGLSKRHLFNEAALSNGYNVLATGHNLDDEAAVLFGNVLRWDAPYLGRQHPVLPAAPGFARKVKPLVRLGERELAAYCVLTGIDYIVEECPMAAGNRHLGYKEALNAIEERSPGAKASFLFGFFDRAYDRFSGDAAEEQGRAAAVSRVAARRHPATSARSAACRPGPPAVACPCSATRSRHREPPVRRRRPRAPRRQQASDGTSSRSPPAAQFHTHAGIVEHDDDHRPRRRHHGPQRHAARGSSRCARPSPSTSSRCRVARRSSIRRISGRS